MHIIRIALGVLALAFVMSGPAAAQGDLTAPYKFNRNALFKTQPKRFIQPITTGQDERVAKEGEALIEQPLTPFRIIRLKIGTDAATISGVVKFDALPAGTILYGNLTWDDFDKIFDVIYCHYRPMSLVKRPQLECFYDEGRNGTLDRFGIAVANLLGAGAMDAYSGLPQRKTPSEYPYEEVAANDDKASKGSIYLNWRRGPTPARPEPGAIYIQLSFSLYANQRDDLNSRMVALYEGKPTLVDVKGGQVELLGLTPDGKLRYRVLHTMPLQPLGLLDTFCERQIC